MVSGWGCGGWVELTFLETCKIAKKTQKEGRENTKIFYYLNSEKTMKIFFYCSQKSGF